MSSARLGARGAGDRRLLAALALVAAAVAAALALLLWADGDSGLPDALAAPGGAGEDRADAPPSRTRPGRTTADSGSSDQGAADPTGAARELAAQAVPVAERSWSGSVRERWTERPVPEAEVRLFDGDFAASTTTDADGAFAISWPAGRTAALEVLHERYADARCARVDFELPGDFRLERSAGIDGRVTLRGAGSYTDGRAVLWCTDRRSREPDAEAELAADGTFAFDDLEPGTYAVAASLPDGPLSYEGDILLEAGVRQTVELEVRMGARLSGRVLDDGRRPVEDATLEVLPRAQGLSRTVEELGSIEVRTGADGAYEVAGLAPGLNEVRVSGPWGAHIRETIEMPPGGGSVRRDFVLPGTGTVAGRVSDDAGGPAAGVRVVAGPSWELLPVLARGLRSEDMQFISPEALASDVTDDLGHYSIAGLPAGRELAVACLPADGATDSAPGLALGVQLVAGRTRTVDLVLAAGLALAGRVVTPDGAPVDDVRVRVELRRSRDWVSWGRGRSDAEGRFAVGPLPPGRVRLAFSRDGFRSHSQELSLVAELTEELEVVLEPSYSVRGLVTDPAGLAIPHAYVSARPEEEERGSRRSRRWDAADAFGRFEIDDLRDGSWVISAAARGWEEGEGSRTTVVAPHEDWAELVLHPGQRVERASISGRVTVLGGGGPPERLRFSGLRGGVVELDGEDFEIGGIVPGSVVVRISAQGCVPRALERIELLPGARVDLGLVELEPGTRLVVRVVDEAGHMVRGARVRLFPVDSGGGSGLPRGPVGLREERRRGYVNDAVPRGRWRLRVDADGYRRSIRDLTVRNRPSQSVRVELTRS